MSTSRLNKLFSQAYILGGSPCSGKSTVAEILSAQYGFHYYKADDHESEHMQRAQPDLQPVMFKYSKTSWDKTWSRSPEELLADEMTYYHERFSFILDDLCQLKSEDPVVLEGAAFLPELIEPYPINHNQVIYMIPSIEFQFQHYQQRPWIQQILNACHDPKQAFDNWMKRDELFGQEVARQARANGFQVIQVDGSVGIQGQFAAIQTQFSLGK